MTTFGQVVSGNTAAVERAVKIASERGAKRSIMLPVSAPFHCSLMQPAADAMAEALTETTILPPAVPLVANVTADEARDPEEIRKNLVTQVTGRVRWRESVLALKDKGVDTLVETGTGKVLSGLARRIDREFPQLDSRTDDMTPSLAVSGKLCVRPSGKSALVTGLRRYWRRYSTCLARRQRDRFAGNAGRSAKGLR